MKNPQNVITPTHTSRLPTWSVHSFITYFMMLNGTAEKNLYFDSFKALKQIFAFRDQFGNFVVQVILQVV